MRHPVLALLLVLGATPVVTVPAQAPDPSPNPAFARRAPYRVVLDQLAGSVELQDHRGELLDRWAPGTGPRDTPLASIPPGRPVVVEVVNANPLLYRYEVQAAVVARGNSMSCSGIGSRFASTGFLTSLVAVPGQASPGFGDPAPVGFPPFPPATRGTAQPTASFLAAAVDQLQPAVTSYAAGLARLRDLAASLDRSLEEAAELGESVPLDSVLLRLQATLEGSLPGLRSASQVPLVVRRTLADGLEAAAELAGHAAAIRRGEYAGDSAAAPARDLLDLADAASLLDQEVPVVVRQVQARIRRIELARAGTRQQFSLEASGDYRRITVDVQPTPDFPDALRLRGGRQEILSQPSISFLCQISIGVAFMDQTPEYAAEGGVLVDRDASADRTAPAVLLHLATVRLPWVGALAGLGFGARGRPDLYLGGSIRLLDPLLLNLGVVWQRAPRLPAGMALGSTVTDPSLLADLPRRYVHGFFWGISLGR